MSKVFNIALVTILFAGIAFGQVKKIQYTGTQVRIIVNGSIRGHDSSPSTDDPIPLLILCTTKGQDGSADSAIVAYGTNYYKSKPDTINFTSNSSVNYFLACALSRQPIVSSNFYPDSAFFLDINGTKDTISLKNTINLLVLLTSASVVNNAIQPERFSLKQNYPNPFNPSTKIEFEIPNRASVQISIFNTTGQLVKSIQVGEMNQGVHSAVWDGKDDHGVSSSTGTYFYQVKVGETMQSKKMLLLK